MINSPQTCYIPNNQMYPQGYQPQYCMPQPCFCPDQSAVAARNAQPRYSGVSIEIIEPQVKVPGQSPYACIPQQSVYGCPTGSIYGNAPVPVYQPVMMAPQQPVMMPPQQPVVQQLPPTVMPPVPQPQFVPQVEQTPQPVQQQPTVINQPTVVYPGPETPAPVVTEQPVATPQPAAQTPPAAPGTTPAAPVDLATVITKLKSPNLDEQALIMEDVAQTLESNPSLGSQYLDTNVVTSLVDVLNQDTTKLAGPTPRQQALRQKIMSGQQVTDAEMLEASQLSQIEVGERNKQYALYTLAMLQSALSKEIAKTGVQIPINELPAIESVLKTAKENQNPMLRASALAGLSYIAKPEYKDVLNTVFTIAANDEDPTVQDVAREALAKLQGSTPAATNVAQATTAPVAATVTAAAQAPAATTPQAPQQATAA